MIYTYVLAATTIVILLKIFTSRKLYELMMYADLLTYIFSIYLVVVSFSTGTPYYLDISIVMVMLSFIGTIAITKYLIGGED